MPTIAVLGAGLVGSFIVKKLAQENFTIRAYDKRYTFGSMTSENVTYLSADLSHDWEVRRAIDGCDLVVCGLPGHMGFDVLNIAIDMKKDVVDYSFMPQGSLTLWREAHDAGVTAVVDFGFAPGMSHIFTRDASNTLGAGHQETTIYVGGLPLNPKDEYKAVFSPRDIIEEYTRPARYRADGRQCVEQPFDVKYPHSADVAKQPVVGFISDGLRTLLTTTPVPNLVEYTLRYETHFDKMKSLKEDGFFDPEHVEHTAQVLAKKWQLTNEHDFSYLHVVSKSDTEIITHGMYDQYDPENQVHSMARATGLPVVAMCIEILNHGFKLPGVIAPEYIADHTETFRRIRKYLQKNGIELDYNACDKG